MFTISVLMVWQMDLRNCGYSVSRCCRKSCKWTVPFRVPECPGGLHTIQLGKRIKSRAKVFCTFFVSFFLRNDRRILSRWHFTLLLKYIKLFFYPSSVGSRPVDNDILSRLRSVPCENMQNRLIPLNEKERLGTLHCVWG